VKAPQSCFELRTSTSIWPRNSLVIAGNSDPERVRRHKDTPPCACAWLIPVLIPDLRNQFDYLISRVGNAITPSRCVGLPQLWMLHPTGAVPLLKERAALTPGRPGGSDGLSRVSGRQSHDPLAKGAFFGLDPTHTRGDMFAPSWKASPREPPTLLSTEVTESIWRRSISLDVRHFRVAKYLELQVRREGRSDTEKQP
jgi:hypothetical protein